MYNLTVVSPKYIRLIGIIIGFYLGLGLDSRLGLGLELGLGLGLGSGLRVQDGKLRIQLV